MKEHIFFEPAFNTSSFIVIAAGAFRIVIGASLESECEKLPHIAAYLVKIMYQLAVRHVLLSLIACVNMYGFPVAVVYLKVIRLFHSKNPANNVRRE